MIIRNRETAMAKILKRTIKPKEKDDFQDCGICRSPTLNSPIMLRHATGEGTGLMMLFNSVLVTIAN